MNKNKKTLSAAWVACSTALLLLVQPLSAAKKTIGIGAVEVTPAMLQSASADGTRDVLSRISQSMDGQLIDKIHNTRKFDVFSRSDLDKILKEQEFANSGNVDVTDPNAAKAFMLGGIQYTLTTSISDFQDYKETAYFEGLGETISKRNIRLGAVAKIYDTTTGKLLETANFQLDTGGHEEKSKFVVSSSGLRSDKYILELATEMADRIANRVVDVLYPARVLAVTGDQVTINRGDGTGIEVGQTWSVYALGEALIDPDTGESLGQEEISIGTVEIKRVNPKTSIGIATENYGIERLQVIRIAD